MPSWLCGTLFLCVHAHNPQLKEKDRSGTRSISNRLIYYSYSSLIGREKKTDTWRPSSLVYKIISCFFCPPFSLPPSSPSHLPRLPFSCLLYLFSHHRRFRFPFTPLISHPFFFLYLLLLPFPPLPPPPSVSCQWPHARYLMCCHDSLPRCHHQGHLHGSTEHAHQSQVRIPVLKWLHPVELEYARCLYGKYMLYVCEYMDQDELSVSIMESSSLINLYNVMEGYHSTWIRVPLQDAHIHTTQRRRV